MGKKTIKTYIAKITEREKQLLGWLRKGKSTRDLSHLMEISESTVKFHITNIMKKLKASNRTYAVSLAIELGLLQLK